MIPSTFTLTSARTVTYPYPDGVRGLVLSGMHYRPDCTAYVDHSDAYYAIENYQRHGTPPWVANDSPEDGS